MGIVENIIEVKKNIARAAEKAGKGHEDYQEIGHEKIHMDEREIVADYL